MICRWRWLRRTAASTASGSQSAQHPPRQRLLHRAVRRPPGEVGQLAGIGLQVEQLRRLAVVVAQLPAPAAQHALGPVGGVPVVLAEGLVLPGRAPGRAAPAAGCRRPGRRAPGAPARSTSVRVRSSRETAPSKRAPAAEAPRPGDDQRDARGVLVEVVLPPQPVLADELPVVAGVDHHGVLPQPALVQGVQEPPDALVQVRHQPVVGGPAAPDLLLGVVVEVVGQPPPLVGRVLPLDVPRRDQRQVDVVGVVHREVRLGDDQRKVGRQEAHAQRPRPRPRPPRPRSLLAPARRPSGPGSPARPPPLRRRRRGWPACPARPPPPSAGWWRRPGSPAGTGRATPSRRSARCCRGPAGARSRAGCPAR